MVSPRTVLTAVVLALVGAVLAPLPATQMSVAAPGSAAERTPVAERAPDAETPQVLAISIDGLNPSALRVLGRQRTPYLHRLLDRGAGTLNARSQNELTITLPNHTSMVTGRRIDAAKGGHGVTWNVDRPGSTVQEAAGHDVSSVFSVVHGSGARTALYASKTKFSLFARSWPAGIDRVDIREERDGDLTRAARTDLLRHDRAFTFLHLGGADAFGHAHGFMGSRYLETVEHLDDLVGLVLRAADQHASLDDLTIILTADHGGAAGETQHSDRTRLADYRVPFLVWGPGIDPVDLYDLNPSYRDPGTGRVKVGATSPAVRNGDVANLALDLLGLGSVPGSRFDVEQRLRVR